MVTRIRDRIVARWDRIVDATIYRFAHPTKRTRT